jgi:hypothetical protein
MPTACSQRAVYAATNLAQAAICSRSARLSGARRAAP